MTADFIARNPNMKSCGSSDSTYEKRAEEEFGKSLKDYTAGMRNSYVFGGGFEIDAHSKEKECAIIVHVRAEDEYRPISSYEVPNATSTKRLLFDPTKRHYDVIEIVSEGASSSSQSADLVSAAEAAAAEAAAAAVVLAAAVAAAAEAAEAAEEAAKAEAAKKIADAAAAAALPKGRKAPKKATFSAAAASKAAAAVVSHSGRRPQKAAAAAAVAANGGPSPTFAAATSAHDAVDEATRASKVELTSERSTRHRGQPTLPHTTRTPHKNARATRSHALVACGLWRSFLVGLLARRQSRTSLAPFILARSCKAANSPAGIRLLV
jgi:hypothetical protein